MFKKNNKVSPNNCMEVFAMVSYIVKETEIIPEAYLPGIGVRLGIERDLVASILNGNGSSSVNSNYSKVAIECIVRSIISERSYVDPSYYKKLVNVINMYGYNILLIDGIIEDCNREFNPRKSFK